MSEEGALAKANEIRMAIKRDVEHEMVQVRSWHRCLLLLCVYTCIVDHGPKTAARGRCKRHQFVACFGHRVPYNRVSCSSSS